jgi:hypothetical protein
MAPRVLRGKKRIQPPNPRRGDITTEYAEQARRATRLGEKKNGGSHHDDCPRESATSVMQPPAYLEAAISFFRSATISSWTFAGTRLYFDSSIVNVPWPWVWLRRSVE